MSDRCDVIIPVKNAPWWLGACLDVLLRNTAPEDLGRIIVVDDGSQPDAWHLVQQICQRPGVELVRNGGRPGFGGTCNFGVQRSDARYLLFLNTDCLVSPGTVRKLVAACRAEPSIGLACPLSNNSPVLTLPFRPGFSFEEMDALLERAAQGLAPADVAPDACTVVGNCLLITRTCWEATGEFDPMWGVGYGEETDYQMRAMERGFRGVALTNTYVFHFGNASFRYEADMRELQQRNYQRFLTRWGTRFEDYAARCAGRDPVAMAQARLEAMAPVARPDVLFVLPTLNQTIGGVHAVIDLCNQVLAHGVQARCAIIGGPGVRREFEEPILFGLLEYESEAALHAARDVSPKVIAATLYSTTPLSWSLSRSWGASLVNFVQGYEAFFDNGVRRREVLRSLALADENLTTSRWLAEGTRRLEPRRRVVQLPIGVNEYVFNPAPRDVAAQGKLRLGVALRSAPDKGQWILLEVLHQLAALRDSLCLTVFRADGYELPADWSSDPDTVICSPPTDRGTIAGHLRQCDLFVDASLHEGFGLMPLEAQACGAVVVASDSGGVREFLRDGESGLIIEAVNKPERYVEAIASLIADRERLARMRACAIDVGRSFAASQRFRGYAEYFRELAQKAVERDADLLVLSTEQGFPGLEPGGGVTLSRSVAAPEASSEAMDRVSEVVRALRLGRWVKPPRVQQLARDARRLARSVVERFARPPAPIPAPDLAPPGPLALHALDEDPSVLLPPLDYPDGDGLQVLVDIESPVQTELVLYYSTVQEQGYAESRAIRSELRPGRNVALLTVQSREPLGGRLRLDPGEARGNYQLHRISVGRMPPATA